MLFGSLIDSPSFYKLFDDFEGVLSIAFFRLVKASRPAILWNYF